MVVSWITCCTSCSPSSPFMNSETVTSWPLVCFELDSPLRALLLLRELSRLMDLKPLLDEPRLLALELMSLPLLAT